MSHLGHKTHDARSWCVTVVRTDNPCTKMTYPRMIIWGSGRGGGCPRPFGVAPRHTRVPSSACCGLAKRTRPLYLSLTLHQDKLVKIAKKLKKNNVAVDIVSFGAEEENQVRGISIINALPYCQHTGTRVWTWQTDSSGCSTGYFLAPQPKATSPCPCRSTHRLCCRLLGPRASFACTPNRLATGEAGGLPRGRQLQRQLPPGHGAARAGAVRRAHLLAHLPGRGRHRGVRLRGRGGRGGRGGRRRRGRRLRVRRGPQHGPGAGAGATVSWGWTAWEPYILRNKMADRQRHFRARHVFASLCCRGTRPGCRAGLGR